MRIISLGWGVQSWGLAAMSALGVLPPVDAAVHADTGHERAETYSFAAKWTPWLEARGVRVVTVKGTHQLSLIDEWGGVFLPVFSLSDQDNSRGQLRRQCTQRWKIAPIRRWIREQGVNVRARKSGQVKQWLGITLDEIERMRSSGVLYIENVYPFIEQLDRPWTRGMVMQWLRKNGLDIPVKSSCIFCPYHDRQTWRDIQQSDTGDWEKALAVDGTIRHKRPGYSCYLTALRKPLTDCDFRSQEEHGQLTLWEAEECSGMCFL